MSYLSDTGLKTLANNIKTKFAKKSEIKLHVSDTQPTDAVEGSIWVKPDEFSESNTVVGKVKTVNGVSSDDSGNVQLSGFLERNKAYSVGDIAYSNNLPGLYYLECTTAGTTGAEEQSYTPPLQ